MIQTYTQEDLANITATPAALGVHIGEKFMGMPYRPYPWVLHMEQEILSMLYRPGNEILVVSVPAQSGKTTYCGLLLPLWYLGRHPNHQLMFISYNEKQASKWGLRVRNAMQMYGSALFGVNVSTDSSATVDWKMGNGFGGMMSTGIEGGISGNPGHLIVCVTGDSVVMTPSGPRRVDDIYLDGYDGVDVLSYHHPSSRELYAPVSAARRSQRSDLVRVTTEAGRTLTCTPDHRIWIEGLGYREAHLLQPGWPVRVVPGMWGVDPDQDEQGPGLEDVPSVLPQGSRFHRRVQLLGLRRHRLRGSRHLRETSDERGVHLRSGVHGGRVRRSGHQEAVPMRQAAPEGSQVLLAPMQDEVRQDQEVPAGHHLPDVWRSVQSPLQPPPVLHTEVRGPGPLDPDARQREQPLQDGEFVHLRLPESAPTDHAARRWLRRLWDARRPARPSRRPQPTEQRLGQPGDALQDTPRRPPQERLDTVSLVEHLRQEPTDVYDLTVPATGNFYVNGILIHNCDDLLKNADEANSPAINKRNMDEWDQSVGTRLQEYTKVLLIATRWTDHDVSGEVIQASLAEGYAGIPVRTLNIKAIAEPDPEEAYAMSEEDLANWRDFLGRKHGEGLKGQHSQRFFEMRRGSMSQRAWSAMYQGTPTNVEGGMFPESNWGYYHEEGHTRVEGDVDLPHVNQRVRVWDIASSEGGGDWTVGTLLGRDSKNRVFILDRQRFRHAPGGVETKIVDTTTADGYEVTVLIEEERHGAGKTVFAHYKETLVGYRVEKAKAEGDKESRATPYSIIQNQGRVFLPRHAPWLREWIQEHAQMDGKGGRPKHDDQIDTAAYGVRFLIGGGDSSIVSFYDIGASDDLSPEDQLEQAAVLRAVGL